MNETMTQGAVLMLLGMGTVFCFLSLLVLALGQMSRFLKEPEPIAQATSPASGAATTPDLSDPELLSAITAAVHSFRAKRDQNSQKTK